MISEPNWMFSKNTGKRYTNITGLVSQQDGWPPVQQKNEVKPIQEMADIFTSPQERPKTKVQPNTILDRVGYYINPMNFVKNQIAKNINPFSYRNPYSRALLAIFKKENGREEAETSDLPVNQSRMDFLNLYTGKPQLHNTLSPSEYKPSKSKDPDAVYYKLNNGDELADYLLKTIKADSFGGDQFIKSTPGLKQDPYNMPIKGFVQNPDDKRWIDHFSSSNMGTYVKSLGEDEKGKYVSYYDIWDIEPKDFGTPFELYDRIYYTIDENGNAVRIYPGTSSSE